MAVTVGGVKVCVSDCTVVATVGATAGCDVVEETATDESGVSAAIETLAVATGPAVRLATAVP